MRYKIKNYLSRYILNNKISRYIILRILHGDEKEKTILKKSDSSKFYYVIRFPNSKEGLMSLFRKVMVHIDYAEKNNYIPYIDMKNYKTIYTYANENAWDYYFSQPSDVTETEVYQNNHILSGWSFDKNIFTCAPLFGDNFAKNYTNNKLKSDFIYKHIEFQPSVVSLYENQREILDIDDCLGVYLRGTDYTGLKPTGHPIQPSVEEVIKKCNEYITNYNIKYIFLVTEDQKIFDEMKAYYGSKLRITTFDSFIDNYNNTDLLYKSIISYNNYNSGLYYLTKILLLSNCKYLVSSLTNGSSMALALNGDNYEDSYIFDLGLYE